MNELIKKEKDKETDTSDALGDINEDSISVEENGEKEEEKGKNNNNTDGVDKENSSEKEVVFEGGIEGEKYDDIFLIVIIVSHYL